jgi:hypothetical protein
MADIDIVPKRRSSTWLWVLVAAVVVALLIWMLMPRGDAVNSGSIQAPGSSAAHAIVAHAVAPRAIAV